MGTSHTRSAVVTLSLVLTLSTVALAQIPIVQVTAKSYQEPNRPQNTLSLLDNTRWSAEGKGQWIQYELAGDPWYICGALLDWWQSDVRTEQFEVSLSANGTEWMTIFAGPSEPQAGPVYYSFVQNGVCPATRARYVRITGYSNTVNAWNSLQSVQFYGGNDWATPPAHFWYNATAQVTSPEEQDLDLLMTISDNFPASAWLIPANTSLDLDITPYNTNIDETIPDTAYTRCVAVWWQDEAVPFRVDLVQNGVATPLIQAVSGPSAYTVYPVDPAVDQGNPYFNSFRITPAVDARLAEMVFLFDCNVQPGRQYASSVAASTYQTEGGYNAPGNTVDGAINTRWSAQGDGQTIEYQLPENTYRTLGIQWYQGDKRTAFFDVQMSLDGIDWYPVLTGGQSQHTKDIEWYSFPPTYGDFIRIVGHGNTQNDWNSILEVQFGQPEPHLVAQQ